MKAHVLSKSGVIIETFRDEEVSFVSVADREFRVSEREEGMPAEIPVIGIVRCVDDSSRAGSNDLAVV